MGSRHDDTVSVVVPTYYRNDRLLAAIESILGQDYEPVEIIVVDDSGEGYARPIVEEYETAIGYIAHDRNRGGNPARTSGIKAATGDYIQLLDDDDRLAESKLRRQVDLLQSVEDVGVAYCGLERPDGTKDLPNPEIRGNVLRTALSFGMWPCINSTMLIEREALVDVLPLATRPGADDIGMKIELARRTCFDFVNAPLVWKGTTEESRGSSLSTINEYFTIMREYETLYKRYPSAVRQLALSRIYREKGLRLLHERHWSFHALLALAKACYLTPELDLKLIGLCLSSVFGKPGIRVGAAVFNAVTALTAQQDASLSSDETELSR